VPRRAASLSPWSAHKDVVTIALAAEMRPARANASMPNEAPGVSA